MSPWIWSVDIEGMVGCFACIETIDGVVREGKITKTRTIDVSINRQIYRIPGTIELNNDSADQLEFRTMRTLVLK